MFRAPGGMPGGMAAGGFPAGPPLSGRGRLTVGQLVKLSSRYTDFGDAAGGWMQPGDVGQIVEEQSGRSTFGGGSDERFKVQEIRQGGGRSWWYSIGALFRHARRTEKEGPETLRKVDGSAVSLDRLVALTEANAVVGAYLIKRVVKSEPSAFPLKVAEAESMPSPSERLLAHSVDGPVEVTIGRIVGISATHSGLPRAVAPMVEVDYTARPTWLAGGLADGIAGGTGVPTSLDGCRLLLPDYGKRVMQYDDHGLRGESRQEHGVYLQATASTERAVTLVEFSGQLSCPLRGTVKVFVLADTIPSVNEAKAEAEAMRAPPNTVVPSPHAGGVDPTVYTNAAAWLEVGSADFDCTTMPADEHGMRPKILKAQRKTDGHSRASSTSMKVTLAQPVHIAKGRTRTILVHCSAEIKCFLKSSSASAAPYAMVGDALTARSVDHSHSDGLLTLLPLRVCESTAPFEQDRLISTLPVGSFSYTTTTGWTKQVHHDQPTSLRLCVWTLLLSMKRATLSSRSFGIVSTRLLLQVCSFLQSADFATDVAFGSTGALVLWDRTQLGGSTLASAALGRDDIGMLGWLLDHGMPADVEYDSPERSTLAHAGCQMGKTEIVRALVRHGADVDSPTGWGGDTLLFSYASQGDQDMVRFLVSRGARMNTGLADSASRALPVGDGNPLHHAVKTGNISMVECLLKLGADPNACNRDHRTPGHVISESQQHGNAFGFGGGPQPADSTIPESDRVAIVDLLAKHGAHINVVDKQGRTPLHISATHRLRAVTKKWILLGADANLTPPHRTSPIATYAQFADDACTEMVTFMARSGKVNLNQRDDSGETLLTRYAGQRRPNAKMIAVLLEHGADVDRPNAQGKTPVAKACAGASQENLDAVKILIDHGAQVDICSRDTGNTAVHVAARSGSLDIMQYVASRGRGLLDVTNRQGAKPADDTGGNVEIAGFFERWARGSKPWTLLGHTTQPENMQCGVFSALLAARRRGAEKCWPILPSEMWTTVFKFMAGNDFFFVRVGGRMGAFLLWNGLASTAVELALSAVLDSAVTDMGVIEYLLDRGANISRPSEDGATLLDTACAVGDSDLAKRLIERGFDPNVQNSSGTTPIQYFSVFNDADMVRYLIENGADPSGKGRPAADVPEEEEEAAKDEKEEAAPDDRPFTAADVGTTCWLQLDAQGAPAWARNSRLRVMEVSDVMGIRITEGGMFGNGNDTWIEGFKLQRADPNPGAKKRPGHRKRKPVGRTLGAGFSGDLAVGDEVQVRADVANVRFGWGSVLHGMVGLITSIDAGHSEGRCSVDFTASGGDRNWSAILSELESTSIHVTVEESPLNAFAAHYNDVMVAFLLERGVDPNSESRPGEPMVFLYAKRGNKAMVKCFIEHGANVDSVSNLIKTNDKVSISHDIMEVAAAWAPECSSIGIPFGAPSSRPKSTSGLTAKHVAGKAGTVRAIQPRKTASLGTPAVDLKDVTIILDESCDEVILGSSVVLCNRPLLTYYVALGDVGMVGYLIQKGAKADLPSAVGGTQCCFAARAKHDSLLTLLKTAPDVNVGDENGNSALHALLMPPVPAVPSDKLTLGPKCAAGHTMELEKLPVHEQPYSGFGFGTASSVQESTWTCSGCGKPETSIREADGRYIWTRRECTPAKSQAGALPEQKQAAQCQTLGAAALGTPAQIPRRSLDGAVKERDAYVVCERWCFPSPFWDSSAGLATADGVHLVYAARDADALPGSVEVKKDAQNSPSAEPELPGTLGRVVAKLMHRVTETSFVVEMVIRRLDDGVKALSIGVENVSTISHGDDESTASNVDWNETTGNQAVAFYNGVSGVIGQGKKAIQAMAHTFVQGDHVKLEINEERHSLTFYVNDVEVGVIPRKSAGTSRVAVEIIGGNCELEVVGVGAHANRPAQSTGDQVDWVPAEDTKDAMLKMATALIARGANLNLINTKTETPAAVAVAHGVRCKGDFRILELIIAEMGNVDVVDIEGNSPLLRLLRTGRDLPVSTVLPAVKALLSAGASASAANNNGDTPPALAALIGKVTQDYRILTAILDAGGDVNAVSSEGQTPLHIMLSCDKAAVSVAAPLSRRWKTFGRSKERMGASARVAKEGTLLVGDTNNYPVVGELGVSPGEKVTWKLTATNWVGLAASSIDMNQSHGPRTWMICLASHQGNTNFDSVSGVANAQLRAAVCSMGGQSKKTFELELIYPAVGPAVATIIHNAKRYSLCDTIHGHGEKLSLVTTHFTYENSCEVLAVRKGDMVPTVKPDINAPGNALFKVLNASIGALNGFYGLDIGFGRHNDMPQYINMGPVAVQPLTVHADLETADFAQTTAFSPPPSPSKTGSPPTPPWRIFYDATGCWMFGCALADSSTPYKALSNSATPPAFGWMPNERVANTAPPELVWFDRPVEQAPAVESLEVSTTRMVVDLLESDINLAAGDAEGNTVSMLAACMEATVQEFTITERLLATGGCDVTLANNEGDTMLHMVLSLAQPPFTVATVSLCEQLIAAGANLNAANKLGQTPTLLAATVGARMRDFGLLQRCIDNGGDVNVAAGSDGNNVLHTLLLSSASPMPDDTVSVLQFLFDNNINSSAVNKRGHTAAIIATTMWTTTHDYSILATLIALEADVSTPDKDGSTVLHHLVSAAASATGDAASFIVTLVDRLVAAGVSFDAADKSGDTPLHRLLKSSCGPSERGVHAALMQRLAANTNLSAANITGCTPAIVAVTTVLKRLTEDSTGLEKLRALMQCNPDLNTPDSSGKTALHYVAGAISNQVCDRISGAPASVPADLPADLPTTRKLPPAQQLQAAGAFGQPQTATLGGFGAAGAGGGLGAFAEVRSFEPPATSAFGPAGASGQQPAAGPFGALPLPACGQLPPHRPFSLRASPEPVALKAHATKGPGGFGAFAGVKPAEGSSFGKRAGGAGAFAQPKPFGAPLMSIDDTLSSPAMEREGMDTILTEMAMLLISCGASLAAVDKDKNTPLHVLLMLPIMPSAVHAVSIVVEHMCDRGSANTNAVNLYGDSAVGLAAQAGKSNAGYPLLRLLISRGGKVNLASITSPLVVRFADKNDLDMVRFVCDHGADLDARGADAEKTEEHDEEADGSIGGTAAPTSEGAAEMPVFETPFGDIIVGDGGRSVHVPQSSCHGGFEVMGRHVLLTSGSYTWSMHLHGANASVGVKPQGGANPEPSIFTDRAMTPSDGIVDFKIDFESRTFSWAGRSLPAAFERSFVGSSRIPLRNQVGIIDSPISVTPVVKLNHGATIACVPAGTSASPIFAAGCTSTGIASDDTAGTIIVSGGSGSVGSKLNGRFKRLEKLRDGYPCYTHESGDGCLYFDAGSNFWKLCQNGTGCTGLGWNLSQRASGADGSTIPDNIHGQHLDPCGIWVRDRAIQSETYPPDNYGSVVLKAAVTSVAASKTTPIQPVPVKRLGVCSNTKSAMEIAVEKKNAAMVDLLLDRGAPLSAAPYQATVLHDHDVLKDKVLVKRLLERNADPNTFDEDGVPPLHHAMQAGTKEVAEILITAGTNLNIPDAFGATFLNVMVGRGNVEMTRLLLDQGASPNIPDANGNMPLHVVVEHEFARVGRDTASTTKKGPHTLDKGSEFVEIAELLIERGADKLKLNQQMQTPGQLHAGLASNALGRPQGAQPAAHGSKSMSDVLEVQIPNIPTGGFKFAPVAKFSPGNRTVAPVVNKVVSSKSYTRGGRSFAKENKNEKPWTRRNLEGTELHVTRRGDPRR
jgi:ankyrin repeat protein